MPGHPSSTRSQAPDLRPRPAFPQQCHVCARALSAPHRQSVSTFTQKALGNDLVPPYTTMRAAVQQCSSLPPSAPPSMLSALRHPAALGKCLVAPGAGPEPSKAPSRTHAPAYQGAGVGLGEDIAQEHPQVSWPGLELLQVLEYEVTLEGTGTRMAGGAQWSPRVPPPWPPPHAPPQLC